jgi:hypothetical protein
MRVMVLGLFNLTRLFSFYILKKGEKMMMKRKFGLSSLVLALILFLCVLPTAAVLQEVTVKSSVSTLSPKTNTITIGFPQQYGCTYPAGGSPVCSYLPMNASALTGTVPDNAVYSMFKAGDPVVATSIGGAGDTWIAVAKLFGSRPNEEYITAVVGDPGKIPTPLIGGYTLDIAMNANCSACSGTICTAGSTNVSVLSSGTRVLQKTLMPGQSLLFNGRNDGSSVTVMFVKGEALSVTCGGGTAMTGPQPVSVFIVTIVPPGASVQNDIRTATTTSPDEARPAATAIATPVPTTQSGSLPFAVIGALGMMALVLAARKQ